MVYKQGMKKMLLQAFHAVLDDEIFKCFLDNREINFTVEYEIHLPRST